MMRGDEKRRVGEEGVRDGEMERWRDRTSQSLVNSGPWGDRGEGR
jgi:hypothetical protein